MVEFENMKRYTPEKAAEIIGVTRRTFYNYMKEGRIKAHKVGGRWAIDSDDLAAFIGVDTTKEDEGNPQTNNS